MEKIKQELELLKLKEQLRKIPDISEKYDGIAVIGGKNYINFASNDYLGISTKSDLREEFLSKNSDKLLSSASARLLSGTSSEFAELEDTVSNIFNREASLIYNTGYQCNLGVLSALCTKGDAVFSDKLNHASIIDGMKLCGGDFFRYKHLDYDDLENLLTKKRNNYKRVIIVTESVFSMDGDISDIERLVKIKNKYNCLLMVDEAHAFCTCGGHISGLSYNKDVDIITATFGKAVGSFGAFCVSNKLIIDYLINKSRSFIFSTSIPPLNIAWTNWLLKEKISFLESQKAKLVNITDYAHKLLNDYGIITPSKSHIIPIVIGTNEITNKVSEILKSRGFYIPSIRPPTVPVNTSRLRISLTADTKTDNFKQVLDIVREFLP